MSVESVRRHFTDRGLEDPVIELTESGATVALAAQAIGVQPGEIAKTLSFKLKDRYILIVASGVGKIDNKKYKSFFGEKARMLDFEEVEQVTGHPVGGVCPFGLIQELEIYLDTSLKAYKEVYPAAGSKLNIMKISVDKMQELTNGIWVDVCQDVQL
ncbi:MAG: prolyl-tRNA editing protein [Clostridiales bacterium GWB2_37_7]|nr:MAG: prolyl-tRNA editing protein [Clostridiales bacterium GWB2_37_7]